MKRIVLLCVLLVLQAPSAQAVVDGKVDFDRTVAPLLGQRCLPCHSGANPKGDLDLGRRESALAGGKSGPVVEPGKPDKSLLWELVNGGKMPPKKPLSDREKNVLRQWIASGAEWGTDPIDVFRLTTDKRAGYDWWALQPIRRPAVGSSSAKSPCRNPIDHFVVDKLAALGLDLAPEAGRRILIRRLSFDLLGLPPSPEEVEAFVKDPAHDAYERLVDRYLASPHYGIRWARHWLDIARFGESNGFEFDEWRPNAWPYRDWVVQAFNRDFPYNEFARLQLAGDVLHPDDAEAIKATGFLVCGAYDSVGQGQLSETMRRVVRQDELEDIVGTVGQTFLGLTVNCARCHDHKFDPIRQVEYYRLTAALAGVRHGERDLSPADKEAIALTQKIASLTAEIEQMDKPVRAAILHQRRPALQAPPRPIACWEFRGNCRDAVGSLHGTIHGDARITENGVKVGGNGYVSTGPLVADLTAKTLEVWVTLNNLEQRGGGVLSVESLDGNVFDGIVFAEREQGRWMAGSDNFVRTQEFGGPSELQANRRPIHFAIVYDADGTITGYRDGVPYGRPYKTSAPARFEAGHANVLFGLRHFPALGNRILSGTIHRAQLYDRALSPAEVQCSTNAHSDYIPEEVVVSTHSIEGRKKRERLSQTIRNFERQLAEHPTKVYAMTPREPGPVHFLVRGNPQQLGEVLQAGAVAAVSALRADFGLDAAAPEGQRRRRLAEWITDPSNPLFARVMVNRLWQYHFGTGLVETPNDFGFNGGRPSHPDLLDWLASEFVRQRFSLKAIHRLIVNSATYRQSFSQDPKALRLDAGRRLLWSKPPSRLDAETVRDTILAVAGKLNLRMGGPGYQDFQRVVARGTAANLYLPADPTGDEFNRRTLYRTWARGGRNGLLDTFDCPDPATTAPHRAVTTTPLQALAMLNNTLILRMADRFAERLQRDVPGDLHGQVTRAFTLAYGRTPTTSEIQRAEVVIRTHGLATLARAVFNSNEFLYID
jgi:hypothetical protein